MAKLRRYISFIFPQLIATTQFIPLETRFPLVVVSPTIRITPRGVVFDKIRRFAGNARPRIRRASPSPTFLFETTMGEGDDRRRGGVYIYIYSRGKVTLLWYKLRYSAIRGGGEEGDEEGWRINRSCYSWLSHPPPVNSYECRSFEQASFQFEEKNIRIFKESVTLAKKSFIEVNLCRP